MIKIFFKMSLVSIAFLSSLAFGVMALAQDLSTPITGQEALDIVQALQGIGISARPDEIAQLTCLGYYDIDIGWNSGCNFFNAAGIVINGLKDTPSNPSASNFMRDLGARPGHGICSVNAESFSCAPDASACSAKNLKIDCQ